MTSDEYVSAIASLLGKNLEIILYGIGLSLILMSLSGRGSGNGILMGLGFMGIAWSMENLDILNSVK